MRRGLAIALAVAVVAGAFSASAGSPAFGRQRKRPPAPSVSATPEPKPAAPAPPPPAVPQPPPPAADPLLFPRPPEIESRVRFWTRVYSEVETNEGFVHDNRDLGIVYDVVRWPRELSESDASEIYEGVKKHYADVLRRLARMPRAALTLEERRVLALFPEGVSQERLEEASEGVRFQRGQADKFRDGVIRSGQWEAYIAQVLRERGLPRELSLLPHVESSFNPLAYSKVGAAGLWQFMPSTGRLFRLRVDGVVDERFDPWRATEAAAALLANNYRVTGSWPLALIAYNHGPGGPIRAVRELGTDDIGVILTRYEGPSFGFASRNFYPSFLAAVEVDRDRMRYFGQIEKMPPARHEAVVTDGYYSARAIAQSFGVDLGMLREWNLGLRDPVWRGQQLVPKGVTLRFPPVAGRPPAAQILASIPQERPVQVAGRGYIVRRGDTLSSIARRYGVSQRALASANGIRKASALHVGRRLRIPGTIEQEIVADAAERRPPARTAASSLRHTVRRGETLASIARRYAVSQGALASANGIRDPRSLRAGQRLRVPSAAGSAAIPTAAAASVPRAKPDRGERATVHRAGVDADAVGLVPAHAEVGARRVPVHDRDAEPVRHVHRRAVPEQLLGAGPAQRLLEMVGARERAPEAGMHEQEVALGVVQAQRAEELLVSGRQREALRARRGPIEVVVGEQRLVAAVGEEHLGAEVLRPLPAQEVEEHRLVVAQEEHRRALGRQADQPVDHAAGVGTAVDVVAQEDEPVVGPERQRLEQLLELVQAAMDVADRVEHAASSRRRRARRAVRRRRRCRRRAAGAA